MAEYRLAEQSSFSWQLPVKDKDLTAPPTTPAEGDRYIVGPSATGAWATHDDDIAWWDTSAWQFDTPAKGWKCCVEDEDEYYYFITSWVEEGAGNGDVVGPASAVDSNLAAFDGTSGKLIKDSGKATIDIHNKQHSIISTDDHTSTATPGKVLKADANGLPVDATNTDTDVADAVSKKHTQNTDTDLDATFEATFVKKADNVNVLADITSPGADIEDAVTKKHTQGTDTTLGTMTADVAMGTHKLTGLSVPASNGDSIRATTKITEANLEDAVDKKHTATLLGTKTLDETNINDNWLIKYDKANDKLVYGIVAGIIRDKAHYQEITSWSDDLPTAIVYYTDSGKTKKFLEIIPTYNDSGYPASVISKVYKYDGSTVALTMTDSYNYNVNNQLLNKTRGVS